MTIACCDSEPSPRTLANRLNATKSTGPKSPEGKARSSQNARKHGLTSATLPVNALKDGTFNTLVAELTDEFRPSSPSQYNLVQELAHIFWKLYQIPQIEHRLLCQAATGDPQPMAHEVQSSIASHEKAIDIMARQFAANAPTPLTRLWDYQRRLQSRAQSIIRQFASLKKLHQQHEAQDAQFDKEESLLASRRRQDALLNSHPTASPAQNEPNPQSAIENRPSASPAQNEPNPQSATGITQDSALRTPSPIHNPQPRPAPAQNEPNRQSELGNRQSSGLITPAQAVPAPAIHNIRI